MIFRAEIRYGSGVIPVAGNVWIIAFPVRELSVRNTTSTFHRFFGDSQHFFQPETAGMWREKQRFSQVSAISDGQNPPLGLFSFFLGFLINERKQIRVESFWKSSTKIPATTYERFIILLYFFWISPCLTMWNCRPHFFFSFLSQNLFIQNNVSVPIFNENICVIN